MHSNFENLIILGILGNSIVLALNDYKDSQSVGILNQRLNFCGNIFTWIFFAESVIKIIALGLCLSPNSYLRDIWNVIDFIIAISGVVEFIASNQNSDSGGMAFNMKPLRVVRVIRPLKSINAMPSMR
jgi:voltage-dependent calcium channel N type alpha-1B